jgi:hypothetical protein
MDDLWDDTCVDLLIKLSAGAEHAFENYDTILTYMQVAKKIDQGKAKRVLLNLSKELTGNVHLMVLYLIFSTICGLEIDEVWVCSLYS